MVTRGETFRHAEPKLTVSKLQRREQRLKAARPFVEEQKKRHHQVIMSQLTLVQALASRRALMPVPAYNMPLNAHQRRIGGQK